MEYFVWAISFGRFRLDDSYGICRLGMFVGARSSRNVRLGTLAWTYDVGNVRLAILIW